jgi:hypothetical protein
LTQAEMPKKYLELYKQLKLVVSLVVLGKREKTS